ncbi:MAG: DegT/DnrJ/EryC1/StrS aminotransferase family protein [Nitrososphaerota archaeon]
MFKYPIAEPEIGEEELKNVLEAVKSGWISSKGKFIEEFENSFSKYIGVKYGVATSNGTAALHLALVALGIGLGDEVIVPDLTFAATINSVIYTGAKPVIVDIDKEYWCIDPSKVEEAVTSRTKAIIAVHLYGHPCDMDAIVEIAEKHDLYVIEDCAEAHGAEYKGLKVGSFGQISCFSFYGNKIITTGEGGMCLTNDEDLAEKMRILRDHGMNAYKRYWHETIGFNYRMTNLQAALGLAQLNKIESFIEKKRKIAKIYAEELSKLQDITPHPEMPWAKCVYWLYTILIGEKMSSIRNILMERLAREGIETRNMFYPLHEMPIYRNYESSSCSVSSRISKQGLSLPSSTKLTEEDVLSITQKLKEAFYKYI